MTFYCDPFKTNTPRVIVALAIFWMALLLGTSSAQAIVVGNPTPNFSKGEFGVGLSLDDFWTGVFADIGITEPGTLKVLYGTYSQLGVEGAQFGVGYRHNLEKSFDIGDTEVQIGALGYYVSSSFESTFAGLALEYGTTTIMGGGGGTITPAENLSIYSSVVYERVQAEVVVFGTKAQATTSNIGLILGAEYWVGENFVSGLELHPGLEDDQITIFAEFKF